MSQEVQEPHVWTPTVVEPVPGCLPGDEVYITTEDVTGGRGGRGRDVRIGLTLNHMTRRINVSGIRSDEAVVGPPGAVGGWV